MSAEPIDTAISAEDMEPVSCLWDYAHEIDDCKRGACIDELFAALPAGMFARTEEPDVFEYIGGFGRWSERAVARIEETLARVKVSRDYNSMFAVSRAIDNPLETDLLFSIDGVSDWHGADQSGELMSFVSRLNEGELIYIGGILDYHK